MIGCQKEGKQIQPFHIVLEYLTERCRGRVDAAEVVYLIKLTHGQSLSLSAALRIPAPAQILLFFASAATSAMSSRSEAMTNTIFPPLPAPGRL